MDLTRIVLVDDDALVRQGLSLILGGDPGLTVVGEAEDGAAGLRVVGEESPHVVLMDIRMPVMDGIDATARIRQLPDPPRVLVLTTFDDDDLVVRALSAGADGFLLKDTAPAQIVAAVHAVRRGEPILSPQVTHTLIGKVTGGEDPARRDRARALLDRLTDREREVALAVARGLSNSEIAAELYLGVPTVKAHIGRLFAKLEVDNRVQLAICVHEAQLG